MLDGAGCLLEDERLKQPIRGTLEAFMDRVSRSLSPYLLQNQPANSAGEHGHERDAESKPTWDFAPDMGDQEYSFGQTGGGDRASGVPQQPCYDRDRMGIISGCGLTLKSKASAVKGNVTIGVKLSSNVGQTYSGGSGSETTIQKPRRPLRAKRNQARPEPVAAVPVGQADSGAQLNGRFFPGSPHLPVPSPEPMAIEITKGPLAFLWPHQMSDQFSAHIKLMGKALIRHSKPLQLSLAAKPLQQSCLRFSLRTSTNTGSHTQSPGLEYNAKIMTHCSLNHPRRPPKLSLADLRSSDLNTKGLEKN
ncbi:hypothetical protein AAY473_009191 [Plecturocebus cupreus]